MFRVWVRMWFVVWGSCLVRVWLVIGFILDSYLVRDRFIFGSYLEGSLGSRIRIWVGVWFVSVSYLYLGEIGFAYLGLYLIRIRFVSDKRLIS